MLQSKFEKPANRCHPAALSADAPVVHPHASPELLHVLQPAHVDVYKLRPAEVVLDELPSCCLLLAGSKLQTIISVCNLLPAVSYLLPAACCLLPEDRPDQMLRHSQVQYMHHIEVQRLASEAWNVAAG